MPSPVCWRLFLSPARGVARCAASELCSAQSFGGDPGRPDASARPGRGRSGTDAAGSGADRSAGASPAGHLGNPVRGSFLADETATVGVRLDPRSAHLTMAAAAFLVVTRCIKSVGGPCADRGQLIPLTSNEIRRLFARFILTVTHTGRESLALIPLPPPT